MSLRVVMAIFPRNDIFFGTPCTWKNIYFMIFQMKISLFSSQSMPLANTFFHLAAAVTESSVHEYPFWISLSVCLGVPKENFYLAKPVGIIPEAVLKIKTRHSHLMIIPWTYHIPKPCLWTSICSCSLSSGRNFPFKQVPRFSPSW